MSDTRRGAKLAKLGDPKVQGLIDALASGHYMERACRMAGISPSTVYRWISEADKIRNSVSSIAELSLDQQQYVNLADAIIKARDEAAHRAMVSIQKAAQKGTWQAAAWYLERTDPNHYGRRTQITGADSEAVKINVSVEEVTKLLKEVLDEDDNAQT